MTLPALVLVVIALIFLNRIVNAFVTVPRIGTAARIPFIRKVKGAASCSLRVPQRDHHRYRHASTESRSTSLWAAPAAKPTQTQSRANNAKKTKPVSKKLPSLSTNEREELINDIVAELLEKFDQFTSSSSSGAVGNPAIDGFDEHNNHPSATESPAQSQETLLNSVIRVFCTHSEPNFAMPWQRLKQESSTSSGFVVEGNRIMTNAHSVEYGSLIQVKKRKSEKKYLARVVAGSILKVFFGLIFIVFLSC